MTFLPTKGERERSRPVTLKLPISLMEYVAEAAAARGLAQVAIVVDALRLNRDLAARLAQEMARIRAFGASKGLDHATALTEVLALLVELGLEAADKERHAQK